jgi:hypothetical protein
VFTHLELRGNLSSASIPVALVDAIDEGRLHPHGRVLVPAFGGGMTWSAHIIKWGERTDSLTTSSVELSACEVTGIELVRALCAQKCGTLRSDLPEAAYSSSPALGVAPTRVMPTLASSVETSNNLQATTS